MSANGVKNFGKVLIIIILLGVTAVLGGLATLLVTSGKTVVEIVKEKTIFHTVTFTYDGKTVSTQAVQDGGVAIDPNFNRYDLYESEHHYAFRGWKIGNGDLLNISEIKITDDTEFVAHFDELFTVEFSLNNEILSKQEVFAGETVTTIPGYTTSVTYQDLEYTFEGWTVDGKNVLDVPHHVINQNTKICAKFSCSGTLPIVWNGLTNFDGEYVWNYGDKVYYSNGATQYYLDLTTNTWLVQEWDAAGDATTIDGHYTWTDGTTCYYSYDNLQYYLLDNKWINKDWTAVDSELTNFRGNNVWHDGEKTYYSAVSKEYQLVDGKWIKKNWTLPTGEVNGPGSNSTIYPCQLVFNYNGQNYCLCPGYINHCIRQINESEWELVYSASVCGPVYQIDGMFYCSTNTSANHMVFDPETERFIAASEVDWSFLGFYSKNVWYAGDRIFVTALYDYYWGSQGNISYELNAYRVYCPELSVA